MEKRTLIEWHWHSTTIFGSFLSKDYGLNEKEQEILLLMYVNVCALNDNANALNKIQWMA